MTPRRGRGVRADQRAASEARAALEERWRPRVAADHRLAALVTARRAAFEPFHRWSAYRQGFSPELVRRFLAEARPAPGPVLDPFDGSGTVTTECGRRGIAAIGIEAVAALAFLARARALAEAPPWPPGASLDAVLDGVGAAPAHRAAALFALARASDGEGHARGGRPGAGEAAAILEQMREDLRTPLARAPSVVRGDARRLPLAERSAGGILTSPPYLSRYDYARINAAIERAYQGRGKRAARRAQLRASRGARGGVQGPLHPAAEEAALLLRAREEAALERAVRGYFEDLGLALGECARVLAEGAPLWIVIAGAELKGIYVPSDLIAAEQAAGAGLEVEAVVEARRLRAGGRALGDLRHVAPRESLIRCRRP